MQTLIYEYGVRVDKDQIGEISREFWLARKLYNDIITVIRAAREEATQFLTQKSPEYGVLSQRIELANRAFDEAKAANSEDGMKAAAEDRRAARKELWESAKPLRKEYREELSAIYARIGLKKECETYRLRCQAVADGLGSATADDIHATALKAWDKVRKDGGKLSYRSSVDRTQDHIIVRFTSAGGVSADEVLSDRHAMIQMIPPVECRRNRYGEFRFRLGSAKSGRFATGTWQYHRPVPEGARITTVRLIRRRIGPDWRYAIQLQMAVPETPRIAVPEDRQLLATVHCGWNLADSGSTRVAGVANSADPGMAEFIDLPDSIGQDLARSAETQKVRDQNRDNIVAAIKAMAIPAYLDDAIKERWSAIRKLPAQYVSARALTALSWMLDPAMPADSIEGQIIAYAKKDRWLWQAQQHLAARARNRRKNFYREKALEMVRKYRSVMLSVADLKDAALRIKDNGERNELGQIARTARFQAALYEFQQSLKWACERADTAFLSPAHQAHARTCAMCGSTFERTSDLVNCPECGNDYDIKANAAASLWQTISPQAEEMRTAAISELAEVRKRQDEKKSEKNQRMIEKRRCANLEMDECA